MNWCKIFGHKWSYYQQEVPHVTQSALSHKKITIMIDTNFRFCDKCSTNQMRKNFTGKEYTDWDDCELNVNQLRDKKLKSLGI